MFLENLPKLEAPKITITSATSVNLSIPIPSKPDFLLTQQLDNTPKSQQQPIDEIKQNLLNFTGLLIKCSQDPTFTTSTQQVYVTFPLPDTYTPMNKMLIEKGMRVEQCTGDELVIPFTNLINDVYYYFQVIVINENVVGDGVFSEEGVLVGKKKMKIPLPYSCRYPTIKTSTPTPSFPNPYTNNHKIPIHETRL